MTAPRTPQPFPLPHRPISILVAALAAAALTGCALTPTASTSGASAHTLAGRAMGGEQPVSSATIQLFAAGSSGNATTATPLLTAPVLTDAGGNFQITGSYTCPAPDAQVYLTATGGNPGLADGTNNSALSLVAALGDCGALTPSTTVVVNEVTTAAAAYALAPFASSLTQVAASATNLQGLRTAMQTAGMLADLTSGLSPSSALPAGAIPESAKLYTVANILSTCVNSDGTTACSQLFQDAAPAGRSAPTDTFQAALAIAQNPGHNVAALFAHTTPQPPFPAALTQAPKDWTMSIAFTAGGLLLPTSIQVDSLGGVWIAGGSGTLAGFSPQGVPIAPQGFSGNSLYESFALTIDPANNIWIANKQTGSTYQSNSGSIVEVTDAGTFLSGSSGYSGPMVNQPIAIASDANSQIWVANFGTSSLAVLNSSGVAVTNTSTSGASTQAQQLGAGVLSQPLALAIDAGNTAWVTSGNSSTLTQLDQTGTVLNQINCCANASTLALDAVGNLWSANSGVAQLTRVSNLTSGNPTISTYSGGGLDSPIAITLDGSDHLWITNGETASISRFAGTESPEAPGRALSPTGGFGLDAGLLHPYGAAVDPSGNLWVSSYSNNRLIKFIGLATPVKTPAIGLPTQP